MQFHFYANLNIKSKAGFTGFRIRALPGAGFVEQCNGFGA